MFLWYDCYWGYCLLKKFFWRVKERNFLRSKNNEMFIFFEELVCFFFIYIVNYVIFYIFFVITVVEKSRYKFKVKVIYRVLYSYLFKF